MRSIKMVCLAVVAVLALSAVTASAAYAETEFEANKTGGLTGKALSTQELKTGGGATVTCTALTLTGTVTALKSKEQLVSVNLTNCEVSGLRSASVSLADFTFFVPLGVSILNGAGKNIVIKATGLGIECEIEVANGQTLGKGLAKSGKMEIEYVNKTHTGGKEYIEVKKEVEKIESTVIKSNSTTFCGKVGEKSTTGTDTGNAEAELEGAGNNIKVI